MYVCKNTTLFGSSPFQFLNLFTFLANLVSLLTICRFHLNPVIFTSGMADAATCKVGTIMHATVQAGMAITCCCGYCILKAITDLLLLLLLSLSLFKNLRLVLELFKALHLEKGTFTDVLERKIKYC